MQVYVLCYPILKAFLYHKRDSWWLHEALHWSWPAAKSHDKRRPFLFFAFLLVWTVSTLYTWVQVSPETLFYSAATFIYNGYVNPITCDNNFPHFATVLWTCTINLMQELTLFNMKLNEPTFVNTYLISLGIKDPFLSFKVSCRGGTCKLKDHLTLIVFFDLLGWDED